MSPAPDVHAGSGRAGRAVGGERSPRTPSRCAGPRSTRAAPSRRCSRSTPHRTGTTFREAAAAVRGAGPEHRLRRRRRQHRLPVPGHGSRCAARATAAGRRPGWDPAYDWTGYIPFAELPTVLNPPEGVDRHREPGRDRAAVPGPAHHGLVYGYRSQRIMDMMPGAHRRREDRRRGDPADAVRQPQRLRPDAGRRAARAPRPATPAAAGDAVRTWDFQQPARPGARRPRPLLQRVLAPPAAADLRRAARRPPARTATTAGGR